MKRIFLIVNLVTVSLITALSGQTVIRGRSEGTITIPASNVIGNGNITVYFQPNAWYSAQGFRLDPILGGCIGISDIMQISAQTIPLGSKGLGPTEAHVQLTLPGNNVLRFFGLAADVDLFLSTAQDTITITTDKTKPDFNPFLFPSAIIDLDWLALYKSLPLKTYLAVNLADNGELLFRYNQIAVNYGAEWKMNLHSFFLDGGIGLYQEKHTKISAGDAGYDQQYGWLEPGGRYRLKNRFSVVGGVRFMVFESVKPRNGLQPNFFGFHVRLEAPLLYKETNTEAIRTLIFMEQVKEKKADALAKNIESQHSVINQLKGSLEGLRDSTETFDYSNERSALIKRREDIQSKMKSIENIFSDSDKSDSTKKEPSLTIPGGEEE
ncbi:MAG: hypothetical protein PHC61_15815 [Chitinivibrionales bacterium]|nr:hypothetical protein [Chitinivibrionales bacterium]